MVNMPYIYCKLIPFIIVYLLFSRRRIIKRP